MWFCICSWQSARFCSFSQTLMKVELLVHPESWISMVMYWSRRPCCPANPRLWTSSSALLCRGLRACRVWHGQCADIHASMVGSNSSSLSRVSLEHKDPQDPQGHPEPLGPQAWMDRVGHLWVQFFAEDLKGRIFHPLNARQSTEWKLCEAHVNPGSTHSSPGLNWVFELKSNTTFLF